MEDSASASVRHRLIATAAAWGEEFWYDLMEEHERVNRPTVEPVYRTHVLSASFPGTPTESEVDEAILRSAFDVSTWGGHAYIESYAVITEEQWQALASGTAKDVAARARHIKSPAVSCGFDSLGEAEKDVPGAEWIRLPDYRQPRWRWDETDEEHHHGF